MEPTSSTDAQQSPFVPNSILSSGTAHHPRGIAPSPLLQQATYAQQSSRNTLTSPSIGTTSRWPNSSIAHSASASLATSYTTAFSQPGQRSPPSHYGGISGLTPPPNYWHLAQITPGGDGHHYHHYYHSSHHNNQVEGNRNYSIPVVFADQSGCQIMKLGTQHGRAVQTPVDVQVESQIADEKRKRNARASARFRARRKEKEREAPTTIARLEAELRNATEDVSFYRRERDYLAQLILEFPSVEQQYLSRPKSPRHRRTSIQVTKASRPRGQAQRSSPLTGSPAA